jgi:hypothetical protein
VRESADGIGRFDSAVQKLVELPIISRMESSLMVGNQKKN